MTTMDDLVTRFLGWELPTDFSPDGGVEFKRVYNEDSPFGPQIRRPLGTNLLNAHQARQMLTHVLGDVLEQAAKSERRAITFGDIVAQHTIAMRAAVVAGKLESPESGLQWIANTLCGPGHLPDIDAARDLGGAQALFDKEMAEHEAFRAAHPAP